MLMPAKLYEVELNKLYLSILNNLDYQYAFNYSWRDKLEIADSTWNNMHLVSVNSQNHVIGMIFYRIDREKLIADDLQIINFKKNKLSLIFGRDLRQAILDIFFKYRFHKLNFEVNIGNPAEKMYDRWIHRIGGNIVGILHDQSLLQNGYYADQKWYEVLRENFITSEVGINYQYRLQKKDEHHVSRLSTVRDRSAKKIPILSK